MNDTNPLIRPIWGCVVVGAAGSGKTTFCDCMSDFMKACGRRCIVVNLDPGNPDKGYSSPPEFSISELISMQDAMRYCKLGPNGALRYCMQFLERNMWWLADKINCTLAKNEIKNQYEFEIAKSAVKFQLKEADLHNPAHLQKSFTAAQPFFIFDLPGQIELYSIDSSLRNIFGTMTSKNGWNSHISCVDMLESIRCHNRANFISGILMGTACMFTLNLPCLHILSKSDLYGKVDTSEKAMTTKKKHHFADPASSDVSMNVFLSPFDEGVKLHLVSQGLFSIFSSMSDLGSENRCTMPL